MRTTRPVNSIWSYISYTEAQLPAQLLHTGGCLKTLAARQVMVASGQPRYLVSGAPMLIGNAGPSSLGPTVSAFFLVDKLSEIDENEWDAD